MKVELEQNQEELETLQALVEAIWEQQFSTAPALCDPSVPPPQSGPGHTIPSVPTSVHPSPPPALSYCGPMSPSIQALLTPHPPFSSLISPIRGLDADKASLLVPVVVSPGPMDIINIPANMTDKPDDTPVMDHSLTLINIGLALDGPPGDQVFSGQPEVPISASGQPDVMMDAEGANIDMD